MSQLIAHRGAQIVTRPELDELSKKTPAATATWYPVPHSTVLDTVGTRMHEAGFTVEATQLAVMRDGSRMFAVLNLSTVLVPGVRLAVGIRNSTDKSLPMGFCAGNRVFVCDNLAFRSELMVHRKHTRFGQDRFRESIGRAVQELVAFKETESKRIQLYQFADVNDTLAESVILRAYEQQIISHRLLPKVISEWRKPSHDEFQPRTLWSLENGFTTVLGDVFKGSPQRFCDLSIRLQGLLAEAAGVRPQEAHAEMPA